MNLKELYQEIILEYGKIQEIRKIQNFNKDAKGNDLYVETMFMFI